MQSRRRLIPALSLALAVCALVRGLLGSCRRVAPAPALPLSTGAVATAYPIASEVGARVLRRGGNAVDAAVAVQFALAVTYPSAGNIGGGGFMMIATPEGAVSALDYRETAPGKADETLFLDEEGDVIPGSSLHSGLAVGVPGAVRGMWEAHRRFGSMPWNELVQPAIELAEGGFELDPWTAASFEQASADFQNLPERYRGMNNFAEYFHGSPGEVFRQPELAAVLRRIAETGPDGFYQGETARLLVEQVGRAGGIITAADLAGYQARWREPVEGTFRGHRVVSMPPPSSGGVALIQLLNGLENFEPLAEHSVAQIHLVAELEKRVFADRAEFLGDSDFYSVPVSRLIDKEYCARRMAGISLSRKTEPAAIGPGMVVREGRNTTHFSIVDRHRMAVSNTTTLNASYGSGIVVEGAGFLLNNEMDDFSAKAGVPNMFGVTGGEANKVEAGKRMLSSMSPTLVYDREGHLWFVLGSPGGPTIFTTVFQVIVDRIEYGMSLAEAVAAPRFHHQWPPRQKGVDPIRVEEKPGFTLPEPVLAGLEELGYSIEHVERLGDVQAVGIEGSSAVGVSDPRRIGRALCSEAGDG